MHVSPSIGFTASLNVRTWQRTWQRKWRDVLHERQALANEYAQHRLWDDELTRRVETFFKTCRELADWLQEATGFDALSHLHASADLQVCDGVAQTAKHFVRNPHPTRDPITGVVATLNGTANGPRAHLSWTSAGGRNGQADALDLADRCIAEWEKFFQQNGLDPNS
ncbi:hypothetical protein SBE55_20200 [Mycolicibacterium sp. 141076]|uniref:hypothetical protein n=1 Tax=Mycolicibacterium sp. 141076 TaxID=3090599 RepID=UPI00299D3C08|nr:hypothetical protein [Mycolicibacterium sp. 141076]MDX1880127.1 hypothetical protein [Mycolicibacterium sp. 141076]